MVPARYLPPILVVLITLSGSLVAAAEAPSAAQPASAAELAAAAEVTSAAQPASADVPLVDEKVRRLMQDRKYAEAIPAIDEAARADDAPRDYLAYLKGRALYLSGEHDAAVAALDALERNFPKSPWLRRARFAKAVALARKGDFRAAELVYRAEAAYLLGADRKQAIAEVYLEFADAYFKPSKEEEEPDYEKALEFYSRALDVGPKPEKRTEVELLVARCQQELGKHGEAAQRYAKFIEGHADSPLEIEARYRLGECLLAQQKRKEARRAWQDLLAKHPDAPSERIAEATFKLSRTWQIPKPSTDEELSLGVAALETFLKRYPTHNLAGQAHLDIAKSYVHRKRYADAATSLSRFLDDKRYQDREETPEARSLLGLAYQLQKKFDEALVTWREYLAKHPAHKAWSWAQRQVVNTEYLIGLEKYKAKEYATARKVWSEFLAKYPLDARNPRILFQFGQIHHERKEWEAAIGEWRRVVSKYPSRSEAAEARLMIAATLELELGRLEEALEEYRKVPLSAQAAQAIARLQSKSLLLATERVFRCDEPPTVKLTTRNIEAVTVQVYEIDMETYFRKMHLASGVEQLDIALIDPDRTFEFKVPDYAKYQEFENSIELLPSGETRPGVMAVTVSSKTLEATTLVLRSDLDVIVKSSRDEVFVLAENMRTGKPWPGVRLLVSDGRRVFAEAATGDDGVLQNAYKELKDAGDVRVFAVAGGHVASNVVGLQGVGVAKGLSSKGYIYTDRPAYRAGQLVHVRGLIRRAAADVYSVEKGKKYTLEVFDNRDRLLRQQEVTLGAFGSFQDRFVLPATSPQGQYRVLVRDDAGHSYQGAFQVHEYKLEPVRLVIDTPRAVYYRGEEIEGTIRAVYYYGAPLAGREVRYRLADQRVQTATTDGQGEVHFKLATREFSESQPLPLAVTLPERNLKLTEVFFLATQGFGIDVSSVRPVYVAGETFEVTAGTYDAESKPVGRKLTLKVLERTTVEGKVGERVVEEHALETAEADGLARQTLKLEKGGQYVLRAEGTDRFHNPVSGSLLLQISDDSDEVRLRILADRHTYKTGDTAEVKVHWREDPALALVTFQGARILDYRLVELRRGLNPLTIPMTPRLAPNFELAVAVMTDARAKPGQKTEVRSASRFHEASSPFTVERELKVEISAKRKGGPEGPVRPGDEVELAVTTTDPQGKPVAAEVSLAMVEQALLDRFEWPMPPIQEFFRGERREPAVRTTSSITFAYHPETQRINPRLLSEQERLEIAQEEQASLRDAQASAGFGAWGGMGAAGFGGSMADSDRRIVIKPGAQTGDMDVPFDDESPILYPEPEAFGAAQENPFEVDVPDDPFAEPDEDLDAAGVANPFAAAKEPESEGEEGVGGAMADFDSLIDLIKTTVKPDLWRRAGRGGSISPFQTNLSIVTSQTQDVHEKIAERIAELVAQGQAQALAAEMAKAGALLSGPYETGYWNPAIVTGEDGRATVTFTVPERPTAWTLLARGISTDTLAGEATDELIVKKDFFGELKLPLAFTEGDQAEVTVSVHNDAVEEGPIEVVLKTTIDGRSVEERKTINVEAKGIQELPFRCVLRRPDPSGEDKESRAGVEGLVLFELTVTAGGRRDVARQAIPLKPYGVPVFATASGSAASDTTAWVETPKGMALQRPGLEILVGPTVEQSLLDVLLAPAPWCQVETYRVTSGLESATSDLMAALGVQKLLGATRDAGGPQAPELDARIRAAVSLLVSSQNDDGGWSWTGRGGQSNRYVTARVVWAVSLARSAGYPVPGPTYDKAIGYLQTEVTATAESDYESKAILLHALTTAGKSDFPLANRLFRTRPSLSTAALAYLALTFAEMNRDSTAGQLLEMLGKRDLDHPAARGQGSAGQPPGTPSSDLASLDASDAETRDFLFGRSSDGSLPWSHSPAELRALYALAIQQVTPQAPEAKQEVDWLLEHRAGYRWTPDKATGPAAMALCQWFAQSRFEGEHYRLEVMVNDVQAKVLQIDQTSPTQRIEVPASLLEEGKQRITFHLTGRGRYTYQCILGGFVPADALESTTADWAVQRRYEPAPLEVEGREIPRGFKVLQGRYQEFHNPLTQLPVGRRGLVELSVRRSATSDTPEDRLQYLIITEPIPSGTTVIEKSVSGRFERFEILPGAITFYVGNRRSIGTIRYELYGYLPGQYRAGPTIIRNAHQPGKLVVAQPKALAVLPGGAQSSDQYRLTPHELYALGKHHFDKGDLKAAESHLSELFDNWNLAPKVHKDVVKTLLDVHLGLGSPAQVVRFFEIVMEKWPEEQIPFDKSLKIAAAYHEIGEYERSYLSFRATVEASFMRESGVPGFLESQGELLRSVDLMQQLLREYPPEPYVAAATYALAQRVYAKAGEAAEDPKLREQKVNRVDLIRRASGMLESFLTAYPDDPAADQAAFAKANTLLDLEAYERAAAACNEYARRYPKSKLLDSYWFMMGYCNFATGHHDVALEMCRKVAEATPIDAETGRPAESPNKWQAIYILGQVYHSLGRAAEAVAEYRRVEDRFDDAKKSIEYFVRKAIKLPEVTVVKPGEPAEVELEFRNLAACEAKVYRIDLMKFTLLRQSLGGITKINLAGIRPIHETTIELGDGRDYRDRTHTLPLPLKDEGAYLVVCRGEDLHASGLVLVTPLAVEVQHDARAGQVRATVKDVTAGRYLSQVHVKVIGSGNEDFVSGSTDLRGVFVAEGIQGSPTVIAEAGPGRYAFFRSPGRVALMQYSLAGRRTPASLEVARGPGPVTLGTSTSGGAEERINAALDSPTVFEFIETPLEDVVENLKDLHGIEIQLDRRALDDVGIPTDTPITRRLRGISLRSALNLLLRELDLTYMIQDEVLLITTPEEAEMHLTLVAYPVSDFGYRDKSGERWMDFDSLMDLIKTSVQPDTWDDVGGPGSIAPMEVGNKYFLVLSQTQEVQAEIAELLNRVRTMAGIEEGGEPPLKEKPEWVDRGYEASPFGGMGGFGAGMGGAMGGPDLLKGLRDANLKFQQQQVDRLQRTYQGGGAMGGMGGFGGGVGAGGFH